MAGFEVMRVVGARDAGADRLRDPSRLGRDLDLFGEAVRLDLHEVVVLAEDLLVPACGVPRLRRLSRADEPRHFTVQTSGEDDETVRVLREQLLVDARLVVEPFEVRLRYELDEVAVAGVGACE